MSAHETSSLSPRVSIGMPVYNGEVYIREAIDSLLGQTLTNFELIISDNASTDATEAICREYWARDHRIRYLRQGENIGATANFRFVLKEARGEYFMWAAHDDIRESASLHVLVDLLDRNPTALLASSRFDLIDRIGGKSRKYNADWLKAFAGAKWVQLSRFILAGFEKSIHIYGLFRTDILRNRGQLECFTDEQTGWDITFLFNLLIMGDFVICDELLFHYRQTERHPVSVSWKGTTVMTNVRRLFLWVHLMHAEMRARVPKAPGEIRSLLYILLAIAELLTMARLCRWGCGYRMRVVSSLLLRKVTGNVC